VKVPLLLLLIALGPIGLADAYADSDGYYCIGHGYVAYQFGMDTPSNPPRVSIVRTTTSGGIPKPLELALPPLQVHAMRCGEGWVDVAAFTMVHRIILDVNGRPVRYETRRLPGGSRGLSEFPFTPNLARLSRAAANLEAEQVVLGETDRGSRYLLVITAKVVPPAARCRTSITTRIVETDRNGKELRARVIFQGEGTRECGE
jgi:hypothetical protein